MAQDNLKILVGAVAGAMLLLIVLVLGKICSLICHLEGKIDLFKAQISFFLLFISKCVLQDAIYIVSYHRCLNSTYQVVSSILWAQINTKHCKQYLIITQLNYNTLQW